MGILRDRFCWSWGNLPSRPVRKTLAEAMTMVDVRMDDSEDMAGDEKKETSTKEPMFKLQCAWRKMGSSCHGKYAIESFGRQLR